jgi:hypothetical protein
MHVHMYVGRFHFDRLIGIEITGQSLQQVWGGAGVGAWSSESTQNTEEKGRMAVALKIDF